MDERRLEGRDSAVLIDGVVQPSDRLEREFARSNYRTHGGMTSHQRVIPWLMSRRPRTEPSRAHKSDVAASSRLDTG